ncbi:hypothetical protein BKA59DRAFT_454548 [Fusarium tricinctum]|uniref:Ubiquitin-like protease family profile domain-containing protein n=1 Tax=Fusarium tricinctum TaxID=61284 RepID=A0A8K0RVG8_9HYPO|nr:hypothetical protein BKA59DRAFT_454548 [Fusarium tricinctum]
MSPTALSTDPNNPGHPSSGSSRASRTKIRRSRPAGWRALQVIRLKRKLEEFWPSGDCYPSKYKPKNPDCLHILSGMYTVAQRWVKLGRNVDDLWAENGLMEQSINLTGKRIFGQVSILRARELLGVIERDMAQKEEGRDFLPPHDPSTHKSPPVNYPKRTNHEHNGSPVCGTPSQPRGLETSTVNVLRQGGMLWSNHIWECVQSLTLPPGWKVFDPGFPFSNEKYIGNRDRTMTSPRHLVFFCHAEGHWSLCYVDTQGDEICHYNSSQSILMPLDKLQTWLNANKIGSDVKVTEKKCTQQKDSQSCGLYALVFLRTLLEEKEMPLDVDLSLERSYFAEMVDAHRSKMNFTQTEGSPIQASAPDAPDTPTSGRIEREFSPEEEPSSAMTLDSPEPEGPPHPSTSQPWPIPRVQFVSPSPSPSPPSTTARSSPGLDIGTSITVQEAIQDLDNHLTKYQHFKGEVKRMEATKAERDEEMRCAKKDLELRRGELELKRQQVEDMENATMDLDSLEDSDLQVRQWLNDCPLLVHKSWQSLMEGIVAVADARRANAFAVDTERISQLDELHKSLYATHTEVKSLEEEVTARELSLRELEIELNASKAGLALLKRQRAKAFEDSDVDIPDREE